MNNLMPRILLTLLAALGCAAAAANVLDTIVVTNQPSPIPGELLAVIEPIGWKTNCMPLKYRMNTALAQIPNLYNDETLPLAEATAAIRAALKLWSEIPTSFAEMRLEGTVVNPNPPGMDFVNEVSFIYPEVEGGASAFASIMAFPVDVNLVGGEDIDGDGDADVSAAIQTCRDADNDGDHEIPAGFYQAGTIFETDIVFTGGVQFLVDPRAIADPTRPDIESYDLVGIAAHELGHAIGLQHTMVTEIGGGDGTGSTVADGTFGGLGARLARRSLSEEDKAWASYLYREGTAASGPPALQPGDIAFQQRYTIISGELSNAAGSPVVGPSVFARNYADEVVSSAIAGHFQFSYNPATGLSRFLTPALGGKVDGQYELPVPKGIYQVGVEGVDFFPYPFLSAFRQRGLSYMCGSMGWNACAGLVFGNQFPGEEFWSGPLESGAENHFGFAMPVVALAKTRANVDIVIDGNAKLVHINDYDGSAFVPADTLLAARLPRSAVLEVDAGQGILVQAATFNTNHFDAGKIPTFDAAMITTGKVAADGTVRIDVRRPLVHEAPFVAQDEEDSPLYVPDAKLLGDFVRNRMPADEDLFLLLAVPKKPFQPPPWLLADGWDLPPDTSALSIGVDVIEPGEFFGSNAFVSYDGGKTFFAVPDFGFDFELVVAPRK